MLKQELNEKITQVGPGTPFGEYTRRFWIPFRIADELGAEDSPRNESGFWAKTCPFGAILTGKLH